MEGMFLEAQLLPVMGSLIAGGVLLAMVVCAVLYGWVHEKPTHAVAEHELKKAA